MDVGDKFTWVALELDAREIEAAMGKACKWHADVMPDFFSECLGDKREEARELLKRCDERGIDLLLEARKRDDRCDYYVPTFRDVAVAIAATKALNEALRRGEISLPGARLVDLTPFPTTAARGEAFGVYLASLLPDERDWIGAWTYTDRLAVVEACLDLLLHDEACDRAWELIEKYEVEVPREGSARVFVAVYGVPEKRS